MRAARAFSLVELILVIILIGALAAVSAPMIISAANALSQQRETTAIEREAMLALDRITREVRIGRAPVADGARLELERDQDGADVDVVIELGAGDQLVMRIVPSGDEASDDFVLARNVSSASAYVESREGACYVTYEFSTQGIAAPWRSVTYSRGVLCAE